jgi:hypothetical protein
MGSSFKISFPIVELSAPRRIRQGRRRAASGGARRLGAILRAIDAKATAMV